MTVHEVKTRLRAETRKRRSARAKSRHGELASGVADAVGNLMTDLGARSAAIFLSTPSEPETRAAIAALAARGILLFAPVSQPDGIMTWARIDAVTPERAGLGRMPEPDVAPEDTVATIQVDVVICPAAAVDDTGTRLGWGGGYYDQLLADLPAGTPVFALVFDDDVVSELPREEHDLPVTGVVTPSGWRRFSQR